MIYHCFDRLRFVLFRAFFLCFFVVYTKEIKPKSLQFNDIKTASHSALPGDIIHLPEGTGVWSGDQQITLQGGISVIGSGSTKSLFKRSQYSDLPFFKFIGSNGLPSELHHVGFIGNYFSGDKTRKTLSRGVELVEGCINFKISNCRFSRFASHAIAITDKSSAKHTQKGVIFKNEFIDNFYPEVENLGYGIVINGNGTWTTLELGTENSVFIEDNYFSGNRHHIASNNGSRYVFRHNNVKHTNAVRNYSMTDAHGKSSAPVGSRSYEIYNNNYHTAGNMQSRARTAIGIRGGDGVIFNNTSTDSIYRTVELWNEGFSCGSYPGQNQIRSLYIWDNDTNDHLKFTSNGVANNCESSIRKGRDYFLNKKPNYKPFTYPHPSRNIALNKPTSSSQVNTTYSSNFGVDGDSRINKYWAAGRSGEWWQVDLTNVFHVDKIKVTPYYDDSRYYHYTIEGSLDGNSWFTVESKDNNNKAIAGGDIYDTDLHTRFLRIKMNHNSAGKAVHLVEFEAYGSLSAKHADYKNIAQYKPTSASRQAPGEESGLAVDNNLALTSRWGAFPKNQWWMVDLLQEHQLRELTIVTYYGDSRYYQYTIEISLNNKDWKEVAAKFDTRLATKSGKTFYLNNQKARYIRVKMKNNSKNNAVHIVEFRAYGSLLQSKTAFKNSDSPTTAPFKKKLENQVNLAISPNPSPSNGIITFNFPVNFNLATVFFNLADISGKIIKQGKLNDNFKKNFNQKSFNLNLAHLKLETGLYVIKIYANKNVFTEKLIVK